MKYIILIIFSFCITSCTQKTDLINVLTIKLEAKTNGTSFKLSSISDSVYYVLLELKEESLFANIDKLIQDSEGNYYILDKDGINGIIVFSSSGKFLYKIEHKGKGSGEYTSLTDFTLFNNKIIEVDDNVRDKVIQYNKAGKYLKEIQYDKGYNEFYHIKDTLGFFTSCGGYCPDLTIYVKNKKKDFFKSSYKDFLYSSGNNFYINGDHQFVTITFDNKIYGGCNIL